MQKDQSTFLRLLSRIIVPREVGNSAEQGRQEIETREGIGRRQYGAGGQAVGWESSSQMAHAGVQEPAMSTSSNF